MISNPGNMNTRIKIFGKPKNDDLAADAVGNLIKTIWAKKIDLSNSEFQATSKDSEKNSKKFKIRYNKWIKVGMRIKYKDHVYRIIGVLEEDIKSKKQWMYVITEMIDIES